MELRICPAAEQIMPKLQQLKEIANECPGFQARATARAITRFFNMYFRPLDVTSEQFSLLIGIEAALGITVADLAANPREAKARAWCRPRTRRQATGAHEHRAQPPGESNPVVAGGQDEIGRCFGGERTANGEPLDARRG
jgi:hypothetical protein